MSKYEYEVGQRVEVKEGGGWEPVTISGRFVGQHSGIAIYTVTGTAHPYRYAFDLRPLPESVKA